MDLATQAETEALARAMLPHLRAGDVLLLHGPVGVGKSAFARALIQSAMAMAGGTVEPVSSPTYTLVQVYETPLAEIWHADLYRLGDVEELAELGLDAAMDDAITLIEWPERLGPARPDRALEIRLSHGDAPDARQVSLLRYGPGWDWIEAIDPTAPAPQLRPEI